jgi:hypothetical protein
VHSANKIDAQKLPVDLWRLRKKAPGATNTVSDNGHNFCLIFPSECFSLEMPPNDLSHNYILCNNSFFITTDDNCGDQLIFKTYLLVNLYSFSLPPNYSVVH